MSQANKLSSNSMKSGKKLETLSTDLIIEILSRLPVKSIARFRCVSKLWTFMLHCPYFTELFLTRSQTRPRLLLLVEEEFEWSFYSTPQLQIPYEKSSAPHVVYADFQIKFPLIMDIADYRQSSYGYASSLIRFPDLEMFGENDNKRLIFNPNTGHYTILPRLRSYDNNRTFLGFDPIDKQYKVLFTGHDADCDDDDDDNRRILTLGTGELTWRKIHFPLTPDPLSEGICFDGVLYYLAKNLYTKAYMIVCFDVRSEEFKFINAECFRGLDDIQLIHYKGKLGGIISSYPNIDGIELRMWVLEDVEKQEWCKHVYALPENEVANEDVHVVGVTARGEIVLAMQYLSKSFYVFYFDPERNTLQTVEIQGFRTKYIEDFASVFVFVDHVEDLNVNNANQLKSSISGSSIDEVQLQPKLQNGEEVRESDNDMSYNDGVSRKKKQKKRKKRVNRRRRHRKIIGESNGLCHMWWIYAFIFFVMLCFFFFFY